MKNGQSLLEVILALAIFSMIAGVLASMAVGGMTALVAGGDLTRADALVTEAVEKVRAVRDGAWNAIVQPTSETIDNRYQRDVTITDIGVYTKNIKAKVSWESRPGVTNSVERETYLSNWDSKTWIQTDWSNPATFDLISPASSIEYGVAGEIKLKNTGFGDWTQETAAMNLPPTSTQLNGVDAFDQNNAWVVGNGRKIMRYADGSWTLGTSNVTPQNTSFRGVQMLSATDGWVVGNNGWVVRCLVSGNLKCDSGNSGSRDLGSQTWNSISMVSASEGWAVGDGGAIAHYSNVNGMLAWRVQSSSITANLNSVFMVSETDGWAVGASGKIFRYQSGLWLENTDTGSNVWQSVFMLDGSHGWVVGNQGLIHRFDGDIWSFLSDTGTETWYGVRALTDSDIWVVGSGGRIGYWNDISWDIRTPAGNDILRALDIYKNPDLSLTGFAVGNSNTVLRLTRLSSYATFGELTSLAFDMGDASPVQVIEWIGQIPPTCGTCAIKFQIQTAPDAAGTPGVWFPTQWMGPDGDDGDETDYFTNSAGQLIPSIVNGRRWVRYKVRLEGPGSNTPKLEEIRINYK